MRVIAGKYRSRPLRSLKGLDLRPTSDRLRETLFNVLTGGNPAALEGTTWLDLFAGTGAVGIEALSRGASAVYFVESSPAAAKLIEANLQSLGVDTGFRVLKQNVGEALQNIGKDKIRFDFVFLDPPYRMEQSYTETLDFLSHSKIVSTTTTVVAEHTKHFDPGEEFGRLSRYRKLIQGDTVLSFYRLT